MRKLATIRKIEEIKPILGADKIEACRIDGWWVVAQKDEYAVGDLAVYLEIDSWVPNELAPFLSKGQEPREYNGVRGERLRTVRLRGQISQGLLLPISGTIVDTDLSQYDIKQNNLEIGLDVTDMLGIQKWEAPIPAELAGSIEGPFPSFIPKTDQERCQNLINEIFIDNEDSRYEITIKLDGTSFTCYYADGKDGVCSRNWELKVDDSNVGNSFVRMYKESGLQRILREYGGNYAVQGELMGPGIQGNREGLKHHKLFVFHIYNIDTGEYMTPHSRHEILNDLWTMGLDKEKVDHVPVIAMGMSLEDIGVVGIDGLLGRADGSSLNHNVREGLVFERIDGRFSFKVISNEFLLKNKE